MTSFNSDGYDCKFVEEPPDELKCSICLCVARDPLQHGEGGCGRIFCRGCITTHRRKNSQCPHCRRRIATFKDERSERHIQSLRVRCDNEHRGCGWTGELRSLQDHTHSCGYVLVPCTNRCTTYFGKRQHGDKLPPSKIFEVYRKDLEEHLKDCGRRQYTCARCKETDEYNRIVGLHSLICPKKKIKCSNAPQCKKILLQENKKMHFSVCPYQKVACKYRDVGCLAMPLRKDKQDHDKHNKAHLRITMDTVLQLKAQCTSLTKECYKLNEQLRVQSTPRTEALPVSPHTFKISDYAKQKKNRSETNGSPFLTHPRGYKMTLNIYPQDNHIQIECYLMEGEFDDQLEFPFKGQITVELLNQLEDSGHHTQTSSSRPGLGRHRVKSSETAFFELFTFQEFISHESLKLDSYKNCQYLKDDCLVFRVHAEVPSYKPWLQGT